MKFDSTYFHCGAQLKKTLGSTISEVEAIIGGIHWQPEFKFEDFQHQVAYNKALAKEFNSKGWELQPLLRKDPKLIGDFRKGLVFVEVQFGNSSTLYRDYYKFQYGLAEGLLSLAILIVPVKGREFFPTRPASVQNMAEYRLAHTCFTILPLKVPTLLIGLLPTN